MRQAADGGTSSGLDDGGALFPDAGVAWCGNNDECAAGNTCSGGQCQCHGEPPCAAGTYCQSDGSCATSASDAGTSRTDGGVDAGSAGPCFSANGGTEVVCVGQPGMQLGWSVSLCSERVFAAGAPGGSAVLDYANGAATLTAIASPPEHMGESVLCRPGEPTIAGGPSGLITTGVTNPLNLWSLPAFALAPYIDPLAPASTLTPLATSASVNGAHAVLKLTAGSFVEQFSAPEPFGASLATSPDGLPPIVAVGAPQATGGAVYTLRRAVMSPGLEVARDSGNLTSFTRAGVAVAIGNVWPDRANTGVPDNEVLVASDTYIAIFRGDLTYLRKIPLGGAIGSTAGQPVSLVVDEAPLMTGLSVHAFYVGNPNSNEVLRCVGTRCTRWKEGPESKSDFGAAISQRQDSVLIGAPSTNDGAGAVYLYPRLQQNLAGELQECLDNERCCTSAGVEGTCLGGVFCQTTSQVPTRECAQDAGTPDAGDDDAGTVDAGAPGDDAGTIDAGSDEDAGTSDAGWSDGGAGGHDAPPAEFVARGCSSAPGVWALLVIVFARRRATIRVKES